MIKKDFSWVDTHKQLVEYIKTKENDQKELIDLLKSVGIGPFNDKSKEGAHNTELNEIDPFTFFCYIYKYGTKKRLGYLQEIAQKLNITIPQSEKGIPSAQAQKVWLFPYEYERKDNEIERLWSFFHKAISNTISDDDFKDILRIKSIGKTKITEALFYVNPETYLPINRPAKPYISEVLGLNPKFDNYKEYKELLENIKKQSNYPFYELSYEAWNWNNQKVKINYWIFQGNPKVFDFETALKENLLDDWTVSAHKDKIKVGDKVILWITGSKSGCYALAEVTSEPHIKSQSPDDHLWKTEDKSELKAGIKIIHNLVENPILKEDILSVEELAQLKVGNQGTNFSSNQEEFEAMLEIAENKTNRKYWLYAPGEQASKWDEFYELGIMGLGWDEIGDLNKLGDLNDITKTIQEQYHTTSKSYNNALANFEFRDAIKKGDIIIAKRGKKEYLGYGIVTSDYYYDSSKDSYQKCRKVNWKKKGIWEESEHPIVLKTLTDITKYPEYVERLIDLIGIEQTSMDERKEKKTDFPVNKILFGAPGTGKTYKLRNEYFPKYTISEQSITPDNYFEEVVSGLTWWQVIALALLEMGTCKVNDIIENRWVAKKAMLSESKNVRATIWGNLQFHTIAESTTVNYTQRQTPYIFDKTDDKKWRLIEAELKEQAPETYEILDSVNNFKPNPGKEIMHYVFTTFHQSFSYEDFIEGIKPVMEEGNENLTYEIENGIFKDLCLKALNDSENRYAIFIDEINRGNVSAIFGELITLIEPDKRIGTENELKVKLPYSKREFGVPKNVDIYATMNTADRSVEALDTALRRRFSFVEIQPNPEVLTDTEYQDVDLKKLLETINQRIEVLIDKDHQIGHSYFIGIQNLDDLKLVFKDKIIPLLEEYFYGDFGKIGLVLGGDFIHQEENSAKFPNNFTYENEFLEDKRVYRYTPFESWTEDTFISVYEN